jgi:hypothetical protein
MRHRLLAVAFVLSLVPSALLAQAPTPPGQPETGPGGKEYPYASFTCGRYGSGGTEYLVFEPDDPRPESAPVVAFLHGWGALNPAPYGAWITHIVRRGAVVIYPLYQENLATPTAEFTPNAIRALKLSLARLETEPGHVRPEPGLFALAGHSEGGLLVANIAALARSCSLPVPGAVLSVEPGKSRAVLPWVKTPLADLSQVEAGTLLVTLAGSSDNLAGPFDAIRIFRETTSVLPDDKNLVTMVSDDHGVPALVADHFAPCAANEMFAVDALDFYGTWKLFDGLTDAAFYGRNRVYALGSTEEQTFMGLWSDGVPVTPLGVVLHP